MKKKYLLGLIVISLLFVTILSGCGKTEPTSLTVSTEDSNTTTDSTKVIELNLGHAGSTTHHYQVTAEKFAQIVSERTNGQIKINIFPADQLGPGPDELEAVKVGTQDLVITPDAFIANHVSLFNALGMPYQFTTYEQVEKLPGSDAAKLLEEKAFEDGLVILGWNANGFRLMTSNKPINSPADLAGLKIRIGSAKLISDIITTLGANPTPISMSETYTALQTGTVDGQENPTTNILQNKLNEVQDYIAITRHQYVTQPLVMNKTKFESLSPEFQQILLEAGAEVAAQDVQMVRDNEASQLQELIDSGMTVTEPDPEAFKGVLQPLYDQYSADNGTEWDQLIELISKIK